MTEAVLADVIEWQSRPLDDVYPIVYLDCIVVKVREGKRVINKAISPNRHQETDNNEELLEFIMRIRTVTAKPTGFKAVISSELWLDELFSLINQKGVE